MEWPGPGEGVRVEAHGEVPEEPTFQEPGTRYYDLEDDDSVPELGGSRPDRLAGVRPQERVQRDTVEQIIDLVPLPMLDAPEPLMVDQLPEFLKIGVVQVLEVPKISQDSIPQRKLLSEPQLVEQLVEVPVPEGGHTGTRQERTMALNGARLLRGRGATGGRAHATSCGTLLLVSPPAQGGIKYWAGLRPLWTSL